MATNTINTKTNLKSYFESGDKPTENQFQELINSVITQGSDSVVTVTSAADFDLEVNDANTRGPGKIYVYTGTADVIFNLPSVDATNLGLNFHIVNATGNRLTIQTADSDAIDDSGPGATIHSGGPDTDSSSSSSSDVDETHFASVKLVLCKSDWWHVVQGRKTWTTTEFV